MNEHILVQTPLELECIGAFASHDLENIAPDIKSSYERICEDETAEENVYATTLRVLEPSNQHRWTCEIESREAH